jgi:hypothetical protein
LVSALVRLSQFSFNAWDLINRYRMIRILNGRTSWIAIATTGSESIIYFCAVTFHLMDILFGRRGNPLSVVEYKPSWCTLTVRRVRPVVQRYACLLKSDTANHLTARKNQPRLGFWTRQFRSPERYIGPNP